MSLVSLIDNTETDKNTVHSYLDLYEALLSPKKDTARNILEVGIGDFKEKNGGSINYPRIPHKGTRPTGDLLSLL